MHTQCSMSERAKTIQIKKTPKLMAYLEKLVEEEGYGTDPTKVANTLVWRGIEELISKGILDRVKGPATKNTK